MAEPVLVCLPGCWLHRRRGQLERHPERRKIFFRSFWSADGHLRRLPLAGPDALLRLLGAVACSYGYLIAMYAARMDLRPRSSSFSSPLSLRAVLVALLWLYAQTGSFDFVTLQISSLTFVSCGPMCWCRRVSLRLRRQSAVFPLHGWLADTFNEAPVALAMVVSGKLASTPCSASTSTLPVQPGSSSYLIALASSHPLWSVLALVQARLLRR